MMPTNREVLFHSLIHSIGTPYIWGGGSGSVDVAGTGWDCSGYVNDMLMDHGLLPDQDGHGPNSQSLFNRFAGQMLSTDVLPDLGDLVFYGSSKSNITHVMMCLNHSLCIGAQGGGSGTNNAAEAVRDEARVRVRLIRYRSDVQGIARLDWPV